MSVDSPTRRRALSPFSGPMLGASTSRLGIRPSSRIGALAAIAVLAASAPAQQIERVSVDSAGAEGDAASVASVLSGDGSTSAFSSYATNLVAGDTNGLRDVFVRDATTLATVRVSLSSTGLQADGPSYSPSLSGNGRFIAFTSEASNLVPGDTNGVADVFVHDRDPDGNGIFDEGNGVTVRVSVDSFGLEANGGSYGAYNHTISDDGRLVVFRSGASNLVVGDGNGKSDIFVHDLQSGMTTRVSVDSSGAEANEASSLATISGNGAVVAFHSDATNLVPGDTNGVTDVFTHDLLGGVTTRASVDSSGLQFSEACSTPALSADGGVVAFKRRGFSTSSSVAVFGLFVRDMATGSTQQLVGGSYFFQWGFWAGTWNSSWTTVLGFPALSADGSKLAYTTNVGLAAVSCDWCPLNASATASVSVFDRSQQVTIELATYSSNNFSTASNALSWTGIYGPALSDDGGKLAFESDSPDLVAGDMNGARDAFVGSVLYVPNASVAFCFGDGSGSPCPCGNGGQPGAGCANSTGFGGVLAAAGTQQVSADDLVMLASGLPPVQPTLLFSGTNALNGGAGAAFADGLRCAGGSLVRLGVRTSDVTGATSWGPSLAAAGGWQPGDVRRMQAWYRDIVGSPCGNGSNLTNGMELSFY